jgi:hypothetical protein
MHGGVDAGFGHSNEHDDRACHDALAAAHLVLYALLFDGLPESVQPLEDP